MEAFRLGQTILRKEDAGPSVKERDRRRDYLGLPLLVSGRTVGSLVFGRFGGPSYPPEHIRLAEFVAWHVGQLLENRRLSRRIANLEAQRELTRMQDEFISTISHELRTPLGFIKGYVTTLLREDTTWDAERREEFLQIIDDEADRLRELIDNLLDSSRLESGTLSMTLEPTKIAPVVRASVHRIKGVHPDIEIEMDLPEDLPILPIDTTRIAQVIDNFLNNASKYASGSAVKVIARATDDSLRITVQDEGPGIPAEHRPHLFERFYRVPSASTTRGTGLGLYISQKIIEAHGGEIGVESTMGEGTSFYFDLPITEISETEAGGRL
jgi:K+-sensing histidine kinase KdpD